MSVTSVIQSPMGREFLDRYILPFERPAELPVLVPPTTTNPGRMDAAFDYALRFGLAARKMCAPPGQLTAESAAFLVGRTDPILGRDLARRIQHARSLLDLLDDDLVLSEQAAEACLSLACLDGVVRGSSIHEIDPPRDQMEIDELRRLYQVIPWESFEPTDLLLLGPTFGLGSEMIGGAEADLYLDGTILSVKVGRKTGVTRDTMRQLICYAVLSRRYGVDRASGMPPVEYVGVYIARAGAFRYFELDSLIDMANLKVIERGIRLVNDGVDPASWGS
jgi:hypothetical protein